ncbi:MAG: DUF4203 domain-containing protein [Candidatus Omnitrophota bacterium]
MVLLILNAVSVFAALMLLFFGRKLFWLFVGIAGFLYGSGIVAQYFPSPSGLASIVVGTVCGTVCALIAPYFQRVLVAVAGFIAGSYAALWLFGWWTPSELSGTGIVFLAGGVLGFLLAWWLLDAALTVLSALLGAVLLVQAIPFFQGAGPVACLAAFAAGLAVQIQSYQSAKRPLSKLSQ